MRRAQGPQGEALSASLTERAALIPIDLIREDPNFQNLRLPPTTDELKKLADSMNAEGLHVPVIVIQSPDGGFYLRAGFRRTAAARSLGWKHVPAIILPLDTPLVAEYWTNVVENAARDKLTSYEVAHAAKTMRDEFGVRSAEFAEKAGFSESYVLQLLRCIDNLPPQIVEVWRDRAPIPVAMYDKWSHLDATSAVKQMLIYCGRHPKIVDGWTPPPNLRRDSHPLKMASAAGLRRMQRLRFAVEVARSLDDETRKICLQVVDFCSGASDAVPNIYDSSARLRTYKSRQRRDLPPSDVDELVDEGCASGFAPVARRLYEPEPEK